MTEARATEARITGCRVFVGFAQTRPGNIMSLSEEITEWIAAHDGFELVDLVVTCQGTDTFFWQTITLFYSEPGQPGLVDRRPNR